MIFLSRKNGNTCELRVIITELDRAENACTGTRWIEVNDTLNQCNKDPDITNVVLTATYVGDLKDSKLSEYMERLNNANNSAIIKQQKTEIDKKQKVHSDGSEEDEEETDDSEELVEVLKNYNLTCKACNGEGKALVDKEGNIYDCPDCLKIDAYLKGKKEGFEKGYDEGYAACLKHLRDITEKVDVKALSETVITTNKESENGTEAS